MSERDPFFAKGVPLDLNDDLPGTRARQVTDESLDEALATFIVAMQRTGTTREGLRAVLEAWEEER